MPLRIKTGDHLQAAKHGRLWRAAGERHFLALLSGRLQMVSPLLIQRRAASKSD